MNHPDVLRLGSQVLQANINSPIARAANIPIPIRDSTGTWRRRSENIHSIKPSIGAACRLDEPIPCARSDGRAALLSRSSGPRGIYVFEVEEQRFRGWAWQRRRQQRYPGSRESARMGGQRRRHAARVADRIHLGSARPEDGSRAADPGRLERQRHHAIRKRPAAEHHHEQRSRRADLQQPEATQQDRH